MKNYGWIPLQDRTQAQHEAHAKARLGISQFRILGTTDESEEKVDLTELWSHPKVKADIGFEFPGVHQYTGSCFRAGTPVRMADGSEKHIEHIKVGDKVVSHTGQIRSIVNLTRTKYTGYMYTFHLKGWKFPVTTTNDHDCLIAEHKENTNWRYEYKGLKKKKAEDIIVGERFLLPYGYQSDINPTLDLYEILSEYVEKIDINELNYKTTHNLWKSKQYLEIDEKFAWVCGLYLADGSINCTQVQFSLNTTTKALIANQVVEYIKSIFPDIKVRYKKDDNKLNVIITHGIFSHLIKKLISGNTYNKRVPKEFFTSTKSIKLSLIKGWVDGDGHFCKRYSKKKGFCIQGVTVSPGLARDIGSLSISCGIRPMISYRKKAKHQRVPALDVYFSGQDSFNLYPEKMLGDKAKARPKLMERTEFGFTTKITKIDKEFVENEPVFCCEVEIDHSLCVNGTIFSQCVGAGGGNMIFTGTAVEVILFGERQEIFVPFWLLPYGRSRYYMGDRGPGEGSLGSTFAKAITVDGCIKATDPGLPPFKVDDGLSWYQQAEMSWSDGDTPQTMNLLPESKKHLFQTFADLRTPDDVEQAIRNGYAVTTASTLIPSPRVEADGEAYGRVSRQGGHQTTLLGVWRHPTKGGVWFKYVNQWGMNFGKKGMCWIPAADVQSMIRDGEETYAFSKFLDNYPARRIDKSKFKIF